jgi:NADH-quinone oxidoreductase subunit G
VQVIQNKVMRVLPLENEAVNECWLSDRDRFSYEALGSPDRLTTPMVKRDGQWHEADWQQAMEAVAPAEAGGATSACSRRRTRRWRSSISPDGWRRAGGSADFRLRHPISRPTATARNSVARHADRRPRELDRVLLVGSFLRKDQPLIAHRLRQAAKRGAQINVLHSATTTC